MNKGRCESCARRNREARSSTDWSVDAVEQEVALDEHDEGEGGTPKLLAKLTGRGMSVLAWIKQDDAKSQKIQCAAVVHEVKCS